MGQQITYLLFFLAPFLLHFLCQSILQADPKLREAALSAALWGSQWRCHPRAINAALCLCASEEEKAKCEIAENGGGENKDKPLDLPPPARHLFPQGWLSHQIKPPPMENEGDSGL
jgi:hypothetical protein